MNDFNTAEYVVAQAKEGKNLLKRRLLMLIYVLAISAAVGGVVISGWIPLIAVVPIFVWIMVHFTWRTVNVEYKYNIAHGSIAFAECYSSGDDKITVDVPVKDIEVICSLDEDRLSGYLPKKVYDYRGSIHKSPAALALLTYKGEKTAIMFIYDKRVASLLKLYNKNTEL